MKKIVPLYEEFINEADEKTTVINMYKKGKSQAEIADLLKISIDKVVKYTNHLGHIVGKSQDGDRFGDDAQSKQYYGRTLKK